MAANTKTPGKKANKKRQERPTAMVEPTAPKKAKPKPGDPGFKKVNRHKSGFKKPVNTGLLDEITNPRRRPSRSFNDTNIGQRTQEPWRITEVEGFAHYTLLQMQKRWSEELTSTAHAYASALLRPVGYFPKGNDQRITRQGDLKFIEDKLFWMNSTVAKQVRVVVAGVILQMTAKDSTLADLEFPCLAQDWYLETQAEALASLAKTDTSNKESVKVEEQPELAAA